MPLSINEFGLGDPLAQFKVYIANRPDFSNYSSLDSSVNPLSSGEIHAIGQACGNGWRKVFNVYAKLVFALNAESIVPLQETLSWQKFRDHVLLQHSSNTSLLFSPPAISKVKDKDRHVVHIVMGRTYAKSLNLSHSLKWLDHEFALDMENKILVCPYFDYRQLSNIKIIRLVELIKQIR
ncbi:DUF6942 family protein [Paraglaciecola arctica]|uniref:DUF6942 family protein n=1 Tax=Paraglaciecola arctica TaxID=1128911 RepID=UPI0005867ED1|nr:hypothetical protein [Paraglaciecola arctica]